MDIFNIIAGVVTIISFVFALVLYLKDKDLTKTVEQGILGIINTFDKIATMRDDADATKQQMSIVAEGGRDHAISLLRSFSDKNERHPTYTFGFTGDTIEQIIDERLKHHGIGRKGCIVAGQQVSHRGGKILIDRIEPGVEVLAFDSHDCSLCTTRVIQIREAIDGEYLNINGVLSVTDSHRVWTHDKGWVTALNLKVGDQLFNEQLAWEPVKSIARRTRTTMVYGIETSKGNLFVGGYLVHNKI